MKKRPELFNAAGKLMCYLHHEGRCPHPGDHDDKTHASPTKAQLAIYKEWKAQKESGKPPVAPKSKAVPKRAAAPAAKEAGDETSEAPNTKHRGRSASRKGAKKRDSPPAATPAIEDCVFCLGDE